MLVLTGKVSTRPRRTQGGSQLPEFAAALIVLIGFVVIPLLDLTIVPVRWMMAQEMVNGYARKLSLCESFKQAHTMMNADPSLQTKLQNLGGVTIESISLHLRINRVFRYVRSEEVLIVEQPGEIPAAWLPDGAKAPCTYFLEVGIRARIAPAILLPMPGISVPGLTKPIPFAITAAHEWGNCGRDPSTGKFFLNE